MKRMIIAESKMAGGNVTTYKKIERMINYGD